MAIKNLVTWFKGVSQAIEVGDGREIIKVGVFAEAVTDEEKQGRKMNEDKKVSASAYLTTRGRLALTCPNFKYVPAVSTDIRVTMRAYIDETMPEVKDAYKFLYVA